MSRISTALARVLAVLALAGVALAIFLIVSSAVEDSDSGDENKPKVQRQGNQDQGDNSRNQDEQNNPPKYYVVQPGDSLSLIAEKTGVSLERLQQLNPNIDPQLLPSGVKLQLR